MAIHLAAVVATSIDARLNRSFSTVPFAGITASVGLGAVGVSANVSDH